MATSMIYSHSANTQGFLSLPAMLVALFCLVGAGGVTPVFAQEDDAAAEEAQSNRTGSMSEKTYRKLAEAQELADAEDFNGARRVLDELKASPKLSGYEKAQIYNFYGYIYFAQDNYAASIDAYNTVLNQPDIPQGLRDATLYTLAQLYFTTEKWSKAVELVEEWLKTAANPGPQPYILLGSGYYQLASDKAEASASDWQNMISPIETAMRIARERDIDIKEQWYLLLRVAYYELNNLEKVKDILEVLVVNWPKKDYWTMLSAMYGELKSEKRQLASYEAAYDQGLLVRSAELVQLSQLFMQAEVPYKAARVLEKGLEAGTVEKNSENYRLLSSAWQLSGEDRKAIPALKEAARMASDGELDVRLANSYLNISDFDQCVEAVQRGLNRGGVKSESNAYIVLGMCQFEKDNYEAAKKAFRSASRDEKNKKTASQWLQFIEREQQRIEQLERSMEQMRSASAS